MNPTPHPHTIIIVNGVPMTRAEAWKMVATYAAGPECGCTPTQAFTVADLWLRNYDYEARQTLKEARHGRG